jgi:alpha-glucosidase
MKKKWFQLVLSVVIISSAVSCNGAEIDLELTSPNNLNRVEIMLDDEGVLYYTLLKGDEQLVSPSKLGFVLKEDDDFNRNFKVLNTSKGCTTNSTFF